MFVDIESKALVNLKKDTPHKFLSWTDIIHFERLDYTHLKIQFHSNREYVALVMLLVSNLRSSTRKVPRGLYARMSFEHHDPFAKVHVLNIAAFMTSWQMCLAILA